MVGKVPMGHPGTQNWAQEPGGGGGGTGTWLVDEGMSLEHSCTINWCEKGRWYHFYLLDPV